MYWMSSTEAELETGSNVDHQGLFSLDGDLIHLSHKDGHHGQIIHLPVILI